MKSTPHNSSISSVKKSAKGIEYVEPKILKKSPQRVTRAHFWRIPHSSGDFEVSLKLGRYTYTMYGDEVEVKDPKSELTLDAKELEALASYLKENYEPLKDGVTDYIAVDGKLNSATAQQFKEFFSKPEKEELLSIILENQILPSHLLQSLQQRKRIQAIDAFEAMLKVETSENNWQVWFTENNWVLGSDFVRVIEDRKIDTANVADFLMQAYDGFLDIIEIKRPNTQQDFWAAKQYRDNYIPSTELVGTIMQATNYIYEVEREANSQKFLERVDYVKVVKPRGILIYGRSLDWNEEQSKSFRLLNASYHNLTLMTYDHVLERAKRMLGIQSQVPTVVDNLDELPF